jgi:poly(A) polymerase
MAAPPVKQWGLTPAISTALPTPADVALNSALVEELKRQNNYESPAETAKRCEAPPPLLRV